MGVPIFLETGHMQEGFPIRVIHTGDQFNFAAHWHDEVELANPAYYYCIRCIFQTDYWKCCFGCGERIVYKQRTGRSARFKGRIAFYIIRVAREGGPFCYLYFAYISHLISKGYL